MSSMNFALDDYHRNISDKELIDDVKRVSDEITKSPTLAEYNERGSYHSTTLTRRFGSWFKVLELAGLGATRSRLNISKEELFKNLEEVWLKLGQQPRYNDIQKPLSRYSAGTYDNRFGTWRTSLKEFVSYVNNEERSSSEDAITRLDVEPVTKHKTKRTINWRLRFVVMRKDNFKCRSCGRSPATDSDVILHVDHIEAWANGGETIVENLQTLCSICNIGKSNL